MVALVARKLLGRLVPGVTDSEALQRWLLKFGKDSKILSISVEIFVDWLGNQNPPWSAYIEFMPGRLIGLNKWPSVRLVGVK